MKLYLGSSLILSIIFIALCAPLLAPQDPRHMSLEERFSTPSISHPFGLDQNGSDVLAQVVYGSRVSLIVAITVVSCGVLLGLILGSLAGYCGGKTDLLLMRFVDMIYAFPGFLLALALVAVMGPSLNNLIIAMTLTSWTGYTRLIRGEMLYLKEKEFILGAKALGASHLRIIIVHLWPNLISSLVVQVSFGLAATILAESSLSFLGLGAPASTPTWGSLLNSGRQFLVEAPHISIFPGLAILVLVLGFNILGDGLRDKLDPKHTSS